MKNQNMAVDVTRAFKFRLRPDSKRQKEIDLQILLAQQLYNQLLEKSIDAYRKDKDSKINKKNLNQMMKAVISKDKRYIKLYSQARQNVFVRLQKAYQNFFKRVERKKKGERIKVGFPTFQIKR